MTACAGGASSMPRLRALRIGAALAVLLVLSVGRGTAAYWSDAGTVPGGTIRTGSIDLRVDGQDAVGGYAPLDLPRLVPGQTSATVLTVGNVGSVALQWTASTTGTNASNGLLGALRLVVTGASTTDGSTCGGAPLAGSGTTVGGALVGTARTLGPGDAEQVCVQVGLPAGAPETLAGRATDIVIALRGTTGGWSDAADVDGIWLATVPLAAPTVTCSGVAGVNLTMSWSEVPGAKEYRVFDLLGALVATIPAGGLLQASLGGLTGGTVRAVFGSEWVSAGAGC